jgi:tRNA(adenine34) deaminase
MMNDEFWMREALAEAEKCLKLHPSFFRFHPSADVPIGAVCVLENQIIGRGHNRRERDNDPTAHAEVLALREAAQCLGDKHLHGATLYVTLEPCPMCAGALWLARVARLVFGAWDEKAGACGSILDIPRDPRFNHRLQVKAGVLQEPCAELLRDFFEARRNPKPQFLTPNS